MLQFSVVINIVIIHKAKEIKGDIDTKDILLVKIIIVEKLNN